MPIEVNSINAQITGAVDRQTTNAVIDPYATDRTPKVTLKIAGTEYRNVIEYQYVTDMLNLGDPFTCTLPNIDGQYTDKFKVGDSVTLFMAAPDVLGGANVQKLKGLVTNIEYTSDDNGSLIKVTGADLGWHLQNNSGPLWTRLNRFTFTQLCNTLIDARWGIPRLVRTSNDLNRRLKQGRTGATIAAGLTNPFATRLPVIMIEPGEMIADTLITYARRMKALVNVAADGFLQIWQPDYSQTPSYNFEYHKITEPERTRNNVLKASRSESIDGVLTDVTLVGQVVQPPVLLDGADPTEGHFKSRFTQDYKLTDGSSFFRRLTFTDGDQYTKTLADARAKWKAQRAEFDAFQYTVEVLGHTQGSKYYEPDTIATVNDTVNGVKGKFYVQQVSMIRSKQVKGGTITRLLLRKSGLLAA